MIDEEYIMYLYESNRRFLYDASNYLMVYIGVFLFPRFSALNV